MAEPDFHAGDIGAHLRYLVTNADGTAKDISGATVKKLLLQMQETDAETAEHVADFVTTGADGLLEYVTDAAGDLPSDGVLLVQAYLEIPADDFAGRTAIRQYIIGKAL